MHSHAHRSFSPTRTRAVRDGIRRQGLAVLLLIACLGWLIAAAAPPPSGGEFKLRRSTIDGGGGPSTSPDFGLQGTIGQPDVGSMSGSDFVLRGGFHTPSGPSDFVFRDQFE